MHSGAYLSLHVDTVLAPIMRANNDELPDPAVRLYPSAVGAILLPISLFGIGWSGQTASVHWIVPIIFSAIFPLGAMMIFPPVLGYLGGEPCHNDLHTALTLRSLPRSPVSGVLAERPVPVMFRRRVSALRARDVQTPRTGWSELDVGRVRDTVHPSAVRLHQVRRENSGRQQVHDQGDARDARSRRGNSGLSTDRGRWVVSLQSAQRERQSIIERLDHVYEPRKRSSADRVFSRRNAQFSSMSESATLCVEMWHPCKLCEMRRETQVRVWKAGSTQSRRPRRSLSLPSPPPSALSFRSPSKPQVCGSHFLQGRHCVRDIC